MQCSTCLVVVSLIKNVFELYSWCHWNTLMVTGSFTCCSPPSRPEHSDIGHSAFSATCERRMIMHRYACERQKKRAHGPTLFLCALVGVIVKPRAGSRMGYSSSLLLKRRRSESTATATTSLPLDRSLGLPSCRHTASERPARDGRPAAAYTRTGRRLPHPSRRIQRPPSLGGARSPRTSTCARSMWGSRGGPARMWAQGQRRRRSR